MCSLCRLPVAKNHNFGQILTFFWLLYRPPFTDEGQIWFGIADPRYTITCKISSRSVYSVVLWRQKNPNFCLFWTSALSDVASWHQSQKVEHERSAQLQTFPYPTTSKSFLYSNAFMANMGAQSLTLKSVTDRQTKKQTKNQRFWPGSLLHAKFHPHRCNVSLLRAKNLKIGL